MFRFFKNIFNAIIIVLVFIGLNSLYSAHFFDGFITKTSEYFMNLNKNTASKIGDFSNVNPEFNIDTAVNLFGYKTLLAEHRATGQRLIIIDSGRKPLLTQHDIQSGTIDEKLQDLSNKFKYQSSNVSDIKVIDKGYLYSYGKQLPYVKFTARVTKLPINNITAIIAVNDTNEKKQRLLISVNEKHRYSQLITTEFYRAIKEVE